jgi:plastocyanin
MNKRFLKTVWVLFLPFIILSCESNTEKEPTTNPCTPEPVTHEIMWEMGVSGQQASLTIKPGDTVKWIWAEDDMPHDVSSDDSNAPDDFGSTLMTGLGMTYEYTFMEETVFEYHCSIHSDSMFGTITVVECSE